MAERKQKVSIPLTVLSVLIAVIVVFPIVWMVLSSFKPSGELFSYPLRLCAGGRLHGLCKEQPVPGCRRHAHHAGHQLHVRLRAGHLPL